MNRSLCTVLLLSACQPSGMLVEPPGVDAPGFRASYFDDTNFTWLKCTRIDDTIDFDFGSAGPGCGVADGTYSARWTGKVTASFSESYTFHTRSDDGVRLYVDGQLIIDDWTSHAVTENSGQISLAAGQRYKIQLDYFNGFGTGRVALSWSSASLPRQVLPRASVSSQDDACGGPATFTLFKEGSIGARWNAATSTLSYGRPGADGSYDIILADENGDNERPLTYPGWLPNRHQWAEEWHPSGKYIFALVEKAAYAPESGHRRIPADAIPGYGGYTDVWLVTPDGQRAWQLTDVPNTYDHGIIHCAVSEDGTKFAWTERIQAPVPFDMNLLAGAYVFKVADFVDGPTPHLENIRTFEPGGVRAGGEVDGISRDKVHLAFYSTFETKNLFATPIYTLNMLTGATQRLTTESFAQAPHYTPDGRSIIYMTGHQADIFPLEVQGADWWIMSTDGSNKRRLTFMNVGNHPHSVNHYRLAGTLTFLSNTVFLGDVMTHPLGLTGNIVKVTCD